MAPIAGILVAWAAAGLVALAVLLRHLPRPGRAPGEPVGEVTTPKKHGFRVRMTRMVLTSPPSLTSGYRPLK